MNTYMAEESEKKRLLGALFLSIAVHIALLFLIKSSGWGTGFTNVGLSQGGPISVQMGFETSTGSEPSASRSATQTETAAERQDNDRPHRQEVSVATNFPKPSALTRPSPEPRQQTTSDPDRQPEVESEPEVEPEPAIEPEPPIVDTPDVLDPVMEVQRQPVDEHVGMESMLTSPTGATTIPEVQPEARPERSDTAQVPETEPEPELEPIQEPELEDELADGQTDQSPDAWGASSTQGSSGEQARSDSEVDGGSVDEVSQGVGEPSGQADGSSAPSPPPSGGDMLGLGGRLVYPKAAETARGGPIEYSVTYEILVSQTGTVLDLVVVDSWFDRDLDQRTTNDLLRTAELMIRGLLTFGPYTSDYRMTVVLTFDSQRGPSLSPESRIRPISD